MLIRVDFPKQRLIAYLSFERHNALVVDSKTNRTLGVFCFHRNPTTVSLFWQPFPQALPPAAQDTVKRRSAQRQMIRKDYQKASVVTSDLKAEYLKVYPNGSNTLTTKG